MKIPLKYQSSEYDCVPVCFLNALNFLFEREDIPAEVIKYVMIYSLDTYSDTGELGINGTSQAAIRFIGDWLCRYLTEDFQVSSEIYTDAEVDFENNQRLLQGLKNGGVVLCRILLMNNRHYVLVTGLDDKTVALFDPYYQPDSGCQRVEWVQDSYKMNRIVQREHFNSVEGTSYSLGPIQERECLVMFKKG